MTGRWILVEGRPHRCTRCGSMVESTWRWCDGRVQRHAMCEPCVAKVVALFDELEEAS